MADKDITIGIRTTGAADAVTDLNKVAVACQTVTRERFSMSTAPDPRVDNPPAFVTARMVPPDARVAGGVPGFYQEANAGIAAVPRITDAVNPARDDGRARTGDVKAAIIANAEAGISDLQAGADEAITRAAGEAETFLEGKAAEAAGRMSVNAGTTLDALTETIADAVIQPDQLARLQQAMHQMKVSRESSNSTVLAAIRECMAVDKALQSQIDVLRAQMANITSRAR